MLGQLDMDGAGDRPEVQEIGIDEDDDDDLDDIEETWAERLWGLTEMFPDSLRNRASSFGAFSSQAISNGFYYARQAGWIAATSFTIGILPYVIEQERLDFETQSLQQQKQMLLGPSAAMAGAGVRRT